jgi:hypothetical protein
LSDKNAPIISPINMAMNGKLEYIPNSLSVNLNGINSFSVGVTPPTEHYAHLNILGLDFMKAISGRCLVDFEKNSVTLHTKASYATYFLEICSNTQK